MKREPWESLDIVGAGPAGLAAAIVAARADVRVTVHERAARVGNRFHGDFQGLENWTADGDVLAELAALGIAADFEATPFREVTLFPPGGSVRRLVSELPFFYLVRRGPGAGTLDSALAAQATAAGAEIRFEDTVRDLPKGGIVAVGPHAADVIASGWIFETDLPDGAWAALGEAIAPRGYAYLLAHGGQATLAICIFADFRRDELYLDCALRFFQERIGFRMTHERRFGGAGNIRIPETAVRNGLLYVGEAAGFQDPLWGFGMRSAMRSGGLAARAWLDGSPADYDRLWRSELAGGMRAGVVHRFFYELARDFGYRRVSRSLARAEDPRSWLRRRYAGGWAEDLLFPLVKNLVLRPFQRPAECSDQRCHCTWCRCVRGVALPEKAGISPLEEAS